jgi:hypothetical protein
VVGFMLRPTDFIGSGVAIPLGLSLLVGLLLLLGGDRLAGWIYRKAGSVEGSRAEGGSAIADGDPGATGTS